CPAATTAPAATATTAARPLSADGGAATRWAPRERAGRDSSSVSGFPGPFANASAIEPGRSCGAESPGAGSSVQVCASVQLWWLFQFGSLCQAGLSLWFQPSSCQSRPDHAVVCGSGDGPACGAGQAARCSRRVGSGPDHAVFCGSDHAPACGSDHIAGCGSDHTVVCGSDGPRPPRASPDSAQLLLADQKSSAALRWESLRWESAAAEAAAVFSGRLRARLSPGAPKALNGWGA